MSYKRRDAGDFARQIYEHLKDKHDIFIDVNIQAGDIWVNTIETNISTCDIFIIIVTYGALESQEVEKEVLQAQKERKTIIPCIHRDVEKDDIKWNLSRFQGFEFKNEYDLARNLYLRIVRLQKSRPKDTTTTDIKPHLKSSSETNEDDLISNSNTSASRSLGAPIKSDNYRFRSTTTSIPTSSTKIPSPNSNITWNNKLLTNKIVNSYSFVRKWGRGSIDDEETYRPIGIAVDPFDYVYVADSYNNSVQKFDSNGTLITKWGRRSIIDNKQFIQPTSVAVDPSGDVYVTDHGNNLVQKFDSNGTFITKWGSLGLKDGQFKMPEGIAVNPSGHVYVTDSSNHRVQKFDSNGTFITKWGGSEGRQFDRPKGIAVDPSGDVYVTDHGNNLVQKFDSNGTFITKWGRGNIVEFKQILYPTGIAVDLSGDVYVTDMYNNLVQKFDSSGTLITKWGGSKGTGDGQFMRPYGITVDSSGNIYVADAFYNRIQVFSPSSSA